jgi:hypothetical protein
MNEVLQDLRIERRELHDDACRQRTGIQRKVAAAETRRAAERSRDVPHRGEMAHLVDGHFQNRASPARHG